MCTCSGWLQMGGTPCSGAIKQPKTKSVPTGSIPAPSSDSGLLCVTPTAVQPCDLFYVVSWLSCISSPETNIHKWFPWTMTYQFCQIFTWQQPFNIQNQSCKGRSEEGHRMAGKVKHYTTGWGKAPIFNTSCWLALTGIHMHKIQIYDTLSCRVMSNFPYKYKTVAFLL